MQVPGGRSVRDRAREYTDSLSASSRPYSALGPPTRPQHTSRQPSSRQQAAPQDARTHLGRSTSGNVVEDQGTLLVKVPSFEPAPRPGRQQTVEDGMKHGGARGKENINRRQQEPPALPSKTPSRVLVRPVSVSSTAASPSSNRRPADSPSTLVSPTLSLFATQGSHASSSSSSSTTSSAHIVHAARVAPARATTSPSVPRPAQPQQQQPRHHQRGQSMAELAAPAPRPAVAPEPVVRDGTRRWNDENPPARPRRPMPPSSMSSGSPPVVATETQEERLERDFVKLLNKMDLLPATKEKMKTIAPSLKIEMLRSASVSSPGTSSSAVTSPELASKPARGHARSTSAHPLLSTLSRSVGPGSVPMGQSLSEGATPSSKEQEKKPEKQRKIKKQKSSSSLFSRSLSRSRGGGSKTDNEASDSDDGAAAASKPRRPTHGRAVSTSSGVLRGFRSVSRSGAKERSVDEGPTAPGARKEEGRDEAWWAVRVRSAGVKGLTGPELGLLRGRLRGELPAWTAQFIKYGGFTGLLDLLRELLSMEWREEQHDDAVLLALLRCFKALTLSTPGRNALAKHAPTPFWDFAKLLFSEKRPGDLAARILLVEMIEIVFTVGVPPGTDVSEDEWLARPWVATVETSRVVELAGGAGSGSGGVRRYAKPVKASSDDEEADDGPSSSKPAQTQAEREKHAHVFVRSLLKGSPDENERNKVDFVRAARREKKYKTWVKEIANVVRDYFWVFCHSNNIFWSLEQIDVEAVEAPKVPSGMTGGVEYEAMEYATAHLRLLNAVVRTCSSNQDAFALHLSLFDSGLERVLLILRRASLAYYQPLHLELSRYIAAARKVQFNLGPALLGCVDPKSLSEPERRVMEIELKRVEDAQRRKQAEQHATGPQLPAMNFD